MSGIDQSVILDVCRLTGSFVDDTGNLKPFSGTGFWIRDNESVIFITNKHNVDATICYGNATKYILYTLEIELRSFKGNDPTSVTKLNRDTHHLHTLKANINQQDT
jgi:hypothetical protein